MAVRRIVVTGIETDLPGYAAAMVKDKLLMIEVFGDLWTYEADAKCITTNGFVRRDGKAVMGRGVAKQAVNKWPEIQDLLGQFISYMGNQPYVISGPERVGFYLISYPVKHNWWEKADLELIEQSAIKLVILCSDYDWKTIVLPRPGCGNGQRTWEEVKPAIEEILDDRFHVIDKQV